MLSSGITAVATSGAGSVTLLSAGKVLYTRLVITNEGAVPGFFSVDGGTTWGRIPAATVPSSGATGNAPTVVEWWGRSSSDVLMKRDGASNMSGVYAFADDLTQ